MSVSPLAAGPTPFLVRAARTGPQVALIDLASYSHEGVNEVVTTGPVLGLVPYVAFFNFFVWCGCQALGGSRGHELLE